MKDVGEEWRLLQSLEMMTRMSKGFRQEYVTSVRPPLGKQRLRLLFRSLDDETTLLLPLMIYDVNHTPDLSDRDRKSDLCEIIRDGCCAGEVFVQCMELALRIPSCCKSMAVYSKVLSFLHRMIELLGELILPYLQPAFDVTLFHTFHSRDLFVLQVLLQAGHEAARLCELVTLTHQLVSTFGQKLIPFLTLVLATMLRHIWLCLGPDWDWTGRQRMASSERSLTGEPIMLDEMREKEELQRLTYGFLYAIFANTDALLFLEMPDILQFMLSTIQQVIHRSM